MADWGEKFQAAWDTIRKKAAGCAANTDLEEIKASVQLGQSRVDKALMAGKFLSNKPEAYAKLTKANEGLGKIGEALETVQDVCLDIVAINKIHDAAVALSDESIIYNDPEAAAAAFDSLFQGFGRLCRFLPPPAKAWEDFFVSFNLFGSLVPKIDPNLRWKKQFSQIDGF